MDLPAGGGQFGGRPGRRGTGADRVRSPGRAGTDWAGQLLAAVTVAALICGIIGGGSSGWCSVPAAAGFITAAVALSGFHLVELRASSPMLNLSMFRSRH
jgi:hypothetical protein